MGHGYLWEGYKKVVGGAEVGKEGVPKEKRQKAGWGGKGGVWGGALIKLLGWLYTSVPLELSSFALPSPSCFPLCTAAGRCVQHSYAYLLCKRVMFVLTLFCVAFSLPCFHCSELVVDVSKITLHMSFADV